MKKYDITAEQKVKTVTSLKNGSPLKIYRIANETGKVYPNEFLHYHPNGHEYYIVLTGHIVIQVGKKKVDLKAGEMLQLFPGEVHKVAKVIEQCDTIVIRNEFAENDKVVTE